MIRLDRSVICRKDSGLLLDRAEILFYSSMRSEVIDRKWQRQYREKKKLRQKKEEGEEEAITHYLQIIQFSGQGVKNSEINRLRKQNKIIEEPSW
jgi:hypothetical protein